MLCLRCKAEIDKSFRACPHCGEAVTDFARRYTEEPLDGKYKILERLGAGGMGEVFKAEHTYLGATRVIKVIRAQISGSQDAHDRFLREARVATRVQHPNVAALHDFSALGDGAHYMVWEYIDGENLAQKLRTRGTLPPRTAVRIAVQALHGLEAIHRAGIVHRDISPENLMITRDTEAVKIIDLGVAKIEDPTETASTRTGIFVGKLRYASPEQLGFLGESEKLDARADLYAMGMVLYEMLAGRPPFEATSPHQFYMHHSEEREFQPVDLPPDLPGGTELQAAIRKALQRDRAKRFQSAHEFADALEQVEKSLPDPGAMKTMALAFDADATMKVPPAPSDTLHRTTVRETQAPPPPPPPPPARPPAAATVITAINAPVPPAKKSSSTPVIVVALLFLFLIGAAVVGAWLLTRNRTEKPSLLGQPVSTATTATTATTTAPVAAPSATSVDVTTTAGEPPVEELSAPVTTTTAAPEPTPGLLTKGKLAQTQTTAPAEEEAAPAEEETTPAPEPEPATDDVTYLARGDETHNEAVVEHLRQALRGTTRISVRGGSMESELVTRLRDELPNIDIVPTANVVIDFDGAIEHLQRGRKTRTARATIRKNGKVVFRYVMPREMFRIGNTPAEAFVGVLSDALEE
jgi:serine/threonine-protein kinase